MTIATRSAALAADVAAIRTLATSASIAAAGAAANAATALSISEAAQAALTACNAVLAGDAGGLTAVFTQASPAATWVIRHNLNCYPSVTVTDSSARVVEGDVTYDAADQITVTFVGAFAGMAYLN